jgi:hypothetical protein
MGVGCRFAMRALGVFIAASFVKTSVIAPRLREGAPASLIYCSRELYLPRNSVLGRLAAVVTISLVAVKQQRPRWPA